MAKTCEWENCRDDAEDLCGFCGLKLCRYHLYESPTHDAKDQAIIDQQELIDNDDDDLDDDWFDWDDDDLDDDDVTY